MITKTYFPKSAATMEFTYIRNGHNLLTAIASDGRSIRIDPGMTMPLVRYLEASYGSAFFRDGSLRIGSLFGYTELELAKDGRGDPLDGFYPWFPDGHFDITKARFSLGQWTCCLSRSIDAYLQDTMGPQGFIVTDLGLFLDVTRAIEDKVGERVRDPLVGLVDYIDKAAGSPPLEIGHLAALKKDPGPNDCYRRQREVRVLWERLRPKNHYISENTQAAYSEYCRLQKLECPILDIKVPNARIYATELLGLSDR